MKKQIFAIGSSLAVLSLIATPALGHGGGAFVMNENNATVINQVAAVADTGNNSVDGGKVYADAGNGGDVQFANDGNEGGAGGNAGNAGDGGNITTGNAIATADVSNFVNDNCTEIEPMEDDGSPDEYTYLEKYEEFTDVFNGTDYAEGFVKEYWKKYPKKAPRVINKNYAEVVNDVFAEAITGDNEADGGKVKGDAGNGGDVKNANDLNEGGDGGNVGEAGWGGTISTGIADSLSRVVNRINNNITRIRF